MPDLSASIPAFSGTAIAGTGARESAREWISNVKMVAGQAGWRDGVVFAVAASKLSGTALKWHRARGKQLETWEKWAEELQKVFPDDESNPLALYERMLRRTQGPRESVVDYFFDKSYLCTKCDVKEDTSQWKNLIIAGLQNANHAAILRLKAASFTTSLELLEAAKSLEAGEEAYLSSHGSHRPPSQGGSKRVSTTPEGVETKPKQIAHGSAERAAEPKCYRCRKYGHVVKDCPMPVHRTNNETTKPGAGQPSQYVSASSSSELPNIKYVKTAVVNQKSYDALVDTGSSVCTIKASDAMGCCSRFEEDNLELYGFGQSPVKCLSRFRTTIEIDGVKGEDVMLHVVPDTAQHFSVIIGRTWTELPNIAYVKVDDTFKIMDKRDDTFGHLEPFTQNQALKITTKNDAALEPRSVNFIMASVDLEGGTDVLYQRKGTMTASVFHVASKQLSVPVANTSNCEKVLKKGMSLGRVEEVNIDTAKLSATSETMEVKTATADPIHEKDVATGNDVTTKERQDLLKLLNQHRECFATNIEELGCTNLIEIDIVLKEGNHVVEYLGFVIGEGGVRPGTDKVRAIDEFSAPKDLHEVKRFLGLTSFFRRFVPRYAALSEPLSRLTRKGEAFHWDQDQEDAFQALKSALTSHPVLQLYNPKARTEVHTDACANGLAGILLQADENDVLHPVYYVSKKTSPAERFYHSSKLELLAIVWTIERLRPFLIGIEFTLVTDCQALVYLNATKTLKPQIARWFDMLQEYTFDIRHRPGSKMEHVDAMSRAAVEDPSDPWDNVIADKLDMWMTISLHDQALIIQRSDEEIRLIATILEKKSCDRTAEERALAQNFVLKEGRLFRETEANGKKKLLYVMPNSMRKSLCVKFHDLEGHFGLDRTIAKISETYWFPGMCRYVREHIRRCFECLICKVPSGKEKGLLHPIPPGRRPFETIHADHLGPFVRSKKGNKYILVVIDNLTKYVRLFPSRDTSAKSVIKSCEDFTLSHGLPERIITDRGTCFTSKAFEEFCKVGGIQHVLNSTRHPRANGQVERVNRTLVPTIMTTMDGNDQREWDIGLKGVEAFLNTSYNKSTGRTPFEVLLGYNPKFHDGALREIAETEDNVAWTNPEQLQAEVRTRILDSQAKYKKRFDMRHCSGDTLKAGDVVVMRCAPEHTGEPTKTQPRYKGPLVVTEVKPNDTYEVAALMGTRSRHYATTAHISSQKTWSTSNKDVEDFEEPSDESEGASDARMAEC
ncbi:hypothetical protein V5799_005292 [Amblyomma americanum]|uniref:RNA-directed DNA polymerase n=1 Tax=Amblyomma americanum TaxID=6943 RepID=A0AAQ4DZN7_AMBAM